MTDNFKCDTAEAAMQAAFTGAVRGLHSQRWKQAMKYGACVWNRGKPGLHCAIGWLIPWEKQNEVGPDGRIDLGKQNVSTATENRMFHPELNRWVEDPNFINLLSSMQRAHDSSGSPRDRRARFSVLGDSYGLRWPSDVPEDV